MGALFVSAIRRFAQVAKRSGAAEVYAIACRELDDRDLGLLCLHLRRVDPDWRPAPKERRRLAAALLEAGVADRNIVDQTDIGRTTLWRIRQELVDTPNRARNPALQSGEHVSKRPTATRRSSEPILHVEASSGNGDDRALRLLLGEAS